MAGDPILDWIRILVTFGLGIMVGIIVRRWEINRMQPVIKILDNSVSTVLIDVSGLSFIANRVSILNTGKSGAKDCKAYITLPDNIIRRTAWMLPDDNTALSVTLNVNLPEFIDLCAVAPQAEGRIVTNERGYHLDNTDLYLKYGPEVGDIHATLTVASSNAKPAVRPIILHAIPIVDDKYLGRIIEFIGQEGRKA